MLKPLVLILLLLPNICLSKLRVVAVEEPPMSYSDKHGIAQGYANEIVNALLTTAQMTSEIEFAPEARAINMGLTKGKIALVGFSRTANRENDFHWIGELYRKDWLIYSLNTNKVNLTSLLDLRKLSRIGVVRGDVREEWMLNKGFQNLLSVTQHKQTVQMLLKNRVPVIAYESAGLKSTCQTLDLDCHNISAAYRLNHSSVYLLLSKHPDSKPYVDILKQAYQQTLSSGVLSDITNKWHVKLCNQGYTVDIAQDKPILTF